ncbi:MAG: zinc metallopeptidase [Tissierellia bacterium]|nr:zinc metallopeptidase [Tissierellia bacterium]
MMFYGFEYMIYIIPGLLLAMYAQAKVKSAFSTYSQEASGLNKPAYLFAREILDKNHLSHVAVEPVRGSLTDHYDPRTKVLRLSETVYNSSSVAAISVTTHEIGHALQDDLGYAPLRLRSILVPAANLGSNLAFPLIIVGFIFGEFFTKLGISLFMVAVLFQLVTLPVEFNASNRAKDILSSGYLPQSKQGGVNKVLNAAALTYVASLAAAIGTLLRLMAIAGYGRRRD